MNDIDSIDDYESGDLDDGVTEDSDSWDGPEGFEDPEELYGVEDSSTSEPGADTYSGDDGDDSWKDAVQSWPEMDLLDVEQGFAGSGDSGEGESGLDECPGGGSATGPIGLAITIVEKAAAMGIRLSLDAARSLLRAMEKRTRERAKMDERSSELGGEAPESLAGDSEEDEEEDGFEPFDDSEENGVPSFEQVVEREEDVFDEDFEEDDDEIIEEEEEEVHEDRGSRSRQSRDSEERGKFQRRAKNPPIFSGLFPNKRREVRDGKKHGKETMGPSGRALIQFLTGVGKSVDSYVRKHAKKDEKERKKKKRKRRFRNGF
jgi:hypothetical protein